MMYCFQQGGLVGLISGLVITLWVGIGAQLRWKLQSFI